MLNPVDLLIGPALRHPSGPIEGEVPGSRRPRRPALKVTAVIVAALAGSWIVRRASAARREA
jgi:hypothetical protein